MHGIERTDRLDGKRTSHASENVSVDIDDEAASLEGPQGRGLPSENHASDRKRQDAVGSTPGTLDPGFKGHETAL